MANDRNVARALLDRQHRTYAEEAGIPLADRPGPLYQLLVLTTLLSTRIRASVAIAAARELFAAGYRTPAAMAAASWQDRVDALGRGHYRRYDERTATMLGNAAELCLERWQGDLRRLHREAGRDVPALRRLLTEFPGIGPTGADIYLREVQAVWTDLAPYVDRKVLAGAQKLDLPASAEGLTGLVGRDDVPRLASALVRVSIERAAAGEIREQVIARS
jgi:endonuclease III